MTSVTPVIRMENVFKSRFQSGVEQTILADVSMEFGQGRFSAVVGPSGGGKSTLIRLLNRLDEPTTGRILLQGEDISRLDPVSLRRKVGLVLQRAFLFEGTVLTNLQQPFLYAGSPPPSANDPLLLQTLQLCRIDPDLLGRVARSLSIGQQQRVSLARTLLSKPQVLVLDEPTSALDRPTANGLGATLRDICHQRNLTVIMVTHDLDLAGRYADELVYLEEGRILEQGDPQQLMTHPKSEGLQRFLRLAEEGI